MEEKLSVKRLTIRHYKNKDLYNQYANVRKDSDINIIGDSMTVYGTSVVDDLVNKANANIKEIAETGIPQLNGKIADIKANTYTKAEADGKYQLKGDYIIKSDYVRDSDNFYSEINKKADKDAVYTKTENDERYLRQTDAKETYLTKSDAESTYATKRELNNITIPDSYTKEESDRKYQPQGSYLSSADIYDSGKIKLPNGAKIGVE